MSFFKYKDGKLCCESVPVNEIAEQVGTPVYLYSKNALLHNFTAIETALASLDTCLCYALKANSNEALLSLLAERGSGADVVSCGEIYLALKAGFPPEKIVFAGVGKTDAEIRYALKQNIWSFNVESIEELQLINDVAGQLGVNARVGIRINPDVDIHGHPYITTGKSENKFGLDTGKVLAIFREASSLAHVQLIGLHSHIGSQIRDHKPYLGAIEILSELKGRIAALGVGLEYIDVGGGFGVDYKNTFATADLPAVSLLSKIVSSLQTLGCKIVVEPGRSLIADTGILVTKVLFRKETRGKQFVVVDAGMNDLIRPSLYNAYHQIVPVQEKEGGLVTVDVVGPICESGDFIGKDRSLPDMKRGELLAVMTAGAYGFSFSSNYNARVRPAEVLVDDTSFEIIRARGKLEDLWK